MTDILKAEQFICLDNISFTYPETALPIIQDLGFSFNLGDRIGLLGANGCGKSTLLHIIMGLLLPEVGAVYFRQKKMIKEADFQVLRREVGFVFQNAEAQLFCPTVLEDVAFGLLNLGFSSKESEEMSLAVLDSFELLNVASLPGHRISGGQKRLVALATVLAMQPLAMLLDEPSNDLDPYTRQQLLEYLQNSDKAYILSSHDLDLLIATCTEFIYMEQGQLLKIDKEQIWNLPIVSRGGKSRYRPDGRC